MATRSITVPSRAEGRRDGTQAAILAATRRLLETGAPLASLSVGRIVEEAGVSRATFYLHFPGKQDLISTLAEEQMLQWRALSARLVENPEFSRADLEDAMSGIIAIWRTEGAVLGALIEVAEYDEVAHDVWAGVVGAIGLEAAAVLQARRPDLSRDEAETLGSVISWSMERCFHEMIGPESDPASDARLQAVMADMIWRVSTGTDR